MLTENSLGVIMTLPHLMPHEAGLPAQNLLLGLLVQLDAVQLCDLVGVVLVDPGPI